MAAWFAATSRRNLSVCPGKSSLCDPATMMPISPSSPRRADATDSRRRQWTPGARERRVQWRIAQRGVDRLTDLSRSGCSFQRSSDSNHFNGSRRPRDRSAEQTQKPGGAFNQRVQQGAAQSGRLAARPEGRQSHDADQIIQTDTQSVDFIGCRFEWCVHVSTAAPMRLSFRWDPCPSSWYAPWRSPGPCHGGNASPYDLRIDHCRIHFNGHEKISTSPV